MSETHTSDRRKSRELVLQALFQHEFFPEKTLLESLNNMQSLFKVKKEVSNYRLILTQGLIEHLTPMDTLIKELRRNWSLERMSIVDRNILRIGLYELKLGGEVPPKVVINEAIEIAKKYGNPDSAPFINGILDKAHKEQV